MPHTISTQDRTHANKPRNKTHERRHVTKAHTNTRRHTPAQDQPTYFRLSWSRSFGIYARTLVHSLEDSAHSHRAASVGIPIARCRKKWSQIIDALTSTIARVTVELYFSRKQKADSKNGRSPLQHPLRIMRLEASQQLITAP